MKKFVVLSMERSGSNLLVDLLNTRQSVCFGEIYHKDDMYLRFPVAGFPTIAERNADPLGFYAAMTREVAQRYPNKSMWGYKLFLYHNQAAMELMCSDPEIGVVVLRRENKLARYSSWKKAVLTGEFRKVAGQPSPNEARRVEFIPDEFERRARFEDRVYDGMYGLLSVQGKPHQSIEYCQLGSPEPMRAVYDHLGMEGRASPRVKVRKQGSRFDILGRFSNPETVLEYVRAHELDHWLHERSPQVQSV